MKAVSILASVCLVAVSASLLQEHEAQFHVFKLTHGKTYKNHVEESKRFAIFRDSLRRIEEHNALHELGLVSYKKGINKFSDITLEEFRKTLTLNHEAKPSFNTTKYVKTGASLPTSIDWRTKGQVTGVKDQGTCNNCWAYSLTGSLEAAYRRKSGRLVPFSEQQLNDCTSDINYGCDGGYLIKTFAYLKKNGIESEDSYPPEGVDGKCRYDSSKVVTQVDDYVDVTGADESALLEAVATIGPVAVGIDASLLSDYESGIFEDSRCSNTTTDHAVLVVGYGTENGKDFWMAKNSWGTKWGEQGYFRIIRGQNECCIASDEDVYPVIN